MPGDTPVRAAIRAADRFHQSLAIPNENQLTARSSDSTNLKTGVSLPTDGGMASEQGFHGLDKLLTEELTLGMYVAKLDRPWLETSFTVQGFYIREMDQKQQLATECEFVYVDPRRYRRMSDTPRLAIVVDNKESVATTKKPAKLRPIAPRKPKIYEDETEIAEELQKAQTSIDEAIMILEPIVEKVQRTGRLEIFQIEAAVNPLVSSVLRNKDAVAALLRLRALDIYTYSHCISNAVWAALLGRHIGYSERQINKLAMGCALVDIGKVGIPKDLIEKLDEPTAAEWEVIKGHVSAGLAILHESGLEDRDVYDMVRTHHERLDGSGYPDGLVGGEIPAFGRIAGIVDTYDAMITDRLYAPAMSSFEAVHKLHEWADSLFEKELIEFFTQAIGVFPTGTLVELNTGEVGVVAAQNPARRLRPRMTMILDSDKNPRPEPTICDLNELDTTGKPMTVWITRELPVGAHGIDPSKYF